MSLGLAREYAIAAKEDWEERQERYSNIRLIEYLFNAAKRGDISLSLPTCTLFEVDQALQVPTGPLQSGPFDSVIRRMMGDTNE